MEEQISFQTLYKNYQNKVYRLCLGYVKGNTALAADLCQEVFIKVYENWSGFKGRSSRTTWLYRIAVNTCLNELRQNKRYQFTDLSHLSSRFNDTEDQNTQLNFIELYRCINLLNTVNKSIILLELEEVPQEKIAEIIGISHGAVRTRVNRIKDSLSKCISYE